MKTFDRIRRSRPALNLWLLLAFFVCSAVCLVVANEHYLRDAMNSRLVNLCEFDAAAYQNRRREQPRSAFSGFRGAAGARVLLLDAKGKDLNTGQNRSDLLSRARPQSWIPFLTPPRGPVLIQQTAEYSCIMAFDPLPGRPFDARGTLLLTRPAVWVVPFLCVVCGVLAWYVSLRIRRIEAAVTHFGSGKLGIRLEPDGGDSIGRLSGSFNEMASRIESLVDANRRLCIDVSHELRSPLARLRLASRLARSGAADALDRIEAEASRLHELVDGLLDVARAEIDPAAIPWESLDLQWLLTEIANACSIEARERDCDLHLKFVRAGSIHADHELLRRAIENVVRNAIRHSPSGRLIDLIADGNASVAVITIRDRGPGVPHSAIEDIFRPFYRVEQDRDRNTDGIGLGLAIAKRAIAVHGGSIQAENAAPGLRVEIRLPRRPLPTVAARLESHDLLAAASSHTSSQIDRR